MELFQEHPYESVLQSCEWLVTHGEVQPVRLVHNAFQVRECLESVFPVIMSHAAFPETSERQVFGCQVYNGVIHAATSEMQPVQQLFRGLPV